MNEDTTKKDRVNQTKSGDQPYAGTPEDANSRDEDMDTIDSFYTDWEQANRSLDSDDDL